MANALPEDQLSALNDLIFRGRKIEAIKSYRDLTGEGLKESKDAVEELERSLRVQFPEKFAAQSQGKGGCFGAAAMFCLCAAGVAYWVAST